MRTANRAIFLVLKKLREPIMQPLSNWTRAFSTAIMHKSVCWILSLAKLAATKAAELEGKVAAARTKSWKIAVGARGEEGSTKKPSPTRVAYRFLRTPAGWQDSPVGTTAQQDEVPDAEEQSEVDTDEEDDTYEENPVRRSYALHTTEPFC